MLSFVASIVLILAPFTHPPIHRQSGPPPAIGAPPQVYADLLIHDIQAYVAHKDAEAIIALVQADEAQAALEAAEAAQEAAQARVPVTAPQAAPVSSGGSCTGFSVPDYIIQRESGGDPSAVNPSSGAIGCTQTLPSHYQPGGACAGLDMYSVDGQRACTWNLSNGGTNLAPWAL